MSPSDIDHARRLVTTSKTATLSTLALRTGSLPYPFGSLVAVATDPHERPLLLLSALAEHTKNLAACSHASLLYAEATTADPLAKGRVTLLGEVSVVPATDIGSARERYLARHPEAGAWAGFKDFAFYAMAITEVRFVAGFGKMGWLDVADYMRSDSSGAR
jgi:putative heme iron utilization protein